MTPSRTGWTFDPRSTVFSSVRSNLDFIGTGTSTAARIPSTGVYGYDPPTISGDPATARFVFSASGRDLLLSWEVKNEQDDALSLWLNGSQLWDVPVSPDWAQWFGPVTSAMLQGEGNQLEFRHSANRDRSSGFSRWSVRNVKLWESYAARPAGAQSILETVQGTGFAVLAPYPTPFNTSVTIPCMVESATEVTVDVVNLLGQQVQTLHRGWLPAGQHQVVWEAVDGGGRRVTSGVYLVIVRTKEAQVVRRLVYVE